MKNFGSVCHIFFKVTNAKISLIFVILSFSRSQMQQFWSFLPPFFQGQKCINFGHFCHIFFKVRNATVFVIFVVSFSRSRIPHFQYFLPYLFQSQKNWISAYLFQGHELKILSTISTELLQFSTILGRGLFKKSQRPKFEY